MLRKKRILFFWVLWALSLIGLSLTSQYSLKGSVGLVNFEIATMLTPAGMVHVLLLSENHYLKPYYSHLAETHHVLWQEPLLFISFLSFLIISLILLREINE